VGVSGVGPETIDSRVLAANGGDRRALLVAARRQGTSMTCTRRLGIVSIQLEELGPDA